jgi:hypothetical protein
MPAFPFGTAGIFMTKKQRQVLFLSLIILSADFFMESVAFGTRDLPNWPDYLLLPGGIILFIAGIVTFIASVRTNAKEL